MNVQITKVSGTKFVWSKTIWRETGRVEIFTCASCFGLVEESDFKAHLESPDHAA